MKLCDLELLTSFPVLSRMNTSHNRLSVRTPDYFGILTMGRYTPIPTTDALRCNIGLADLLGRMTWMFGGFDVGDIS